MLADRGFMSLILLWIERTLIAIAGAMSIWCAMTIVDIWQVNSLAAPLGSPLSKPASQRVPVAKAAARHTNSQPEATRRSAKIAPGARLAKLEAPVVGLSVTVLEGTDNKTLMRAAGHLEHTAFPEEAGNTVIAGHRDTIFRPVRNLHVGNALVLTTSQYVYRYRVTAIRIIDPAEVGVLGPTPVRALTLVTCYPFEFIGHAPQRFIVRADLDHEEARSAGPRVATVLGAEERRRLSQ